jgi:hypothetical protein
MNKKSLVMALSIFAVGLGLGFSNDAPATCQTDCRQNWIECRQDCGLTGGSSVCYANCDSARAACLASC